MIEYIPLMVPNIADLTSKQSNIYHTILKICVYIFLYMLSFVMKFAWYILKFHYIKEMKFAWYIYIILKFHYIIINIYKIKSFILYLEQNFSCLLIW